MKLLRFAVGFLILPALLSLSPSFASASTNGATWRPTISNGGLPYGSYRKNIGGVDHVCFMYVNRADRCFPTAAYVWQPLRLW
jgi:hypothetical protein